MSRAPSTAPALAMLLAVPALLLSAAPSAADHEPQVPCLLLGCPDLVVDGARMRPYVTTRTFQPWDCNVAEGTTLPGTRTLLRFTFTTPNVGAGDLFVGSPSLNPELFEYGQCHGHWHFREYADYRVWTPEQFASWNALREAHPEAQAHEILAAHPELQPARGDKRGFCVIDIVPYGATSVAPKYLLCDLQGVSVGWADEYHEQLDGQFVDVTGLPRGRYVLEAEVNAERVFAELSYANDRAWRDVTI